MIMKHETKLTLFSSYFDANDNLSIKSILSIFQDVAANHAEEIGVGYLTMLNKNLYWVLSRVKFDIIKQPQIDETVTVETWPHEKGRIDFDRDMKILSEDGAVLITATSKWCVIDTVNRRLQKTENVNYIGEIHPEINYTEKFDKIALPESGQSFMFSHSVGFCDLDHNKHMNNTNYANLIANAITNKTVTHFEINFINECLENDEISIFKTTSDSGEYIVGKVQDKTVFCSYTK